MLDPQLVAKIAEHEQAAHEKRNWVRLTYDCNNHCVFCLDTLTHDGEMRDPEEVKTQILDGRRKGADRLILSGGEPTIHPRYVDFIKLGRLAGYRKIQTVTNGRLFCYGDFLGRCLDAGLQEITFSVHGPNARIHDALVGAKGAFDQEVQGIRNALADGRPIVNIDIVINRANVKHVKEILDTFIAMGVREYDLLQVIPFGNAFTEGRDVLFYDLEQMRPHLLEIFEYSKRPDLHLWFNRFPVEHMETFEHLIQDPYKLNDEVRGRKEEFARMLYEGIDLDCRDPERCRHCYLQRVCDTLYATRDQLERREIDVVRIDTEWEARQEATFGGDPASAKRAASDAAPQAVHAGRRLRVLGQSAVPRYRPPAELLAELKTRVVRVRAPSVTRAAETLARVGPVDAVELELDDYAGLTLDQEGRFAGARLTSARAFTVPQAQALLAIAADFEVNVQLDRDTAPWLLSLSVVSPRLALTQPTYERLTEAAERDVDLRSFFTAFRHQVPVDGVPACALGRPPRAEPRVLDTAMMTPDGRLEIFRYIKRYIVDHYLTKSLRCAPCRHSAQCRGMHINYVRAHGYGVMQPVADPVSAA